MNQIVKKEDMPVSQTANETAAILSVIERVATNPDVDIEKLERMLDMQERILNRNAKQEFSSALANLQAELPQVEKLAEGHKIKYAKFEHILAAIKPHLINHGFAITHRCQNSDGLVVVTAVLSHRGGHSEETSVTLPADTTGNKNAVQAIGSSMEYGRRYTMNSLLGIATRDADMNGGSPDAEKNPCLTNEQIENLRKAMKVAGVDDKRMQERANINRIEELPQARLAGAMNWLKDVAEGKSQ